ncbi:hypothetical protein EUX98_g1528 [Antrodiella citrinella]|uniref:Meiotically up-regulated protein Msb1/Mug8 domain-containing protein n=1 Tax=Antrodiella citrinella TaxID=2447956 RepID=A0A4S4N9N4_9APHY|nr:hypothetical protein EUX98_g1528 [Antrodiella citrinella]
MPSLFSRSRTASTPKKSTLDVAFDEFGRVTSRNSNKGSKLTLVSPPSSSKKDKKLSKDKSRARAVSSPPEPDPAEYTIPDGFLPLNLDPPRFEQGEEPAHDRQSFLDYGYLSFQRHVVLGLEEVARLVDVVGNELGTRGLTTPFIFSTLALDVSAPAVKRLISAFLKTCGKHPQDAERAWREEAQFAGVHELGMCLRWGLARVVRVIGGQEVRGLVSYEHYMDWREAEAALDYPQTHFGTFLEPLEPLLQPLLVGLLTLLTRFTAHSSSSGHTPPTLSPLFGPLLFGLGPSTLAFHHTYVHYLRTTTATEHLILSYIRWQDSPASIGGGAIGVPTRLKAWIQGYPSMISFTKKNERPQPRRGARTIRMISVRRNVRVYSPDLVKSASGCIARPHGGSATPTTDRSFAGSKEWDRIAPPTLKLAPRYSDAYRKRMVLSPNFHPEVGTGTAAPSLTSSVSTASTASSFLDDGEHGLLGQKPEEDKFRSLTDLKWGEFESMGFGGLNNDEKKLQFDLTEGARAARAAKRATLSWQDFSSSGFTRTDAPLSATLQFSAPVVKSVDAWPSNSAEIHRKLKKTQKTIPPFGWDTEPVMGGEEVIEEAFIDVFCDLVWGGGWMDAERLEDLDRDCNWALVEFKSLPMARTTTSGNADPRTATTLILFEEFVPLEYRQQLAEVGPTRRRLPSLFGSHKQKQWKPPATLNGRPYVVGHVPKSPSYREVEFEGLLRSNGSATKLLSLKTTPERVPSGYSSIVTSPVSMKPSFLSPFPRAETPVQRSESRQSNNDSIGPGTSSPAQQSPTPASANPHRKSSRFRLPVSPSNSRTAGLPPSEYDTVDFEARLASFDDDDLALPSRSKHSRRQSKDDAWVDILVANNHRRIPGQDVERRNGLKSGRSDPELASQEVSEVLAAVHQVLSDDDEEEEEMEPVRGVEERHIEDSASATTSRLGDVDQMTIPGPSTSQLNLEMDEEEDAPTASLLSQQSRRRLGYFDLHPERRTPKLHEDFRAESPTVPVASFDDARVHFERQSTMFDDPRAIFERPSLDSQGDSREDEPTELVYESPTTPVVTPTVPTIITPPPRDDSRRAITPVPKVDVSPPPAEPEPEPVKPLSIVTKNQSKTASLIEMYREKERGGSPSPVLPTSKLPVRTGSLPALTTQRPVSPAPSPLVPSPSAPAAAPPAPTSIPTIPSAPASVTLPTPAPPAPVTPPAPAPIVSPIPAPSLIPVLSPASVPLPASTPSPRLADDELFSEPQLFGQGTDNLSLLHTPSRYVHGAPLHNVLEEEEYEEEE